MKILFITPRIPYPPIKGDSLRSYYFIRELAKNHAVDLVTFYEQETELAGAEELKKLCGSIRLVPLKKISSYLNVLMNVFSGDPLQVSYYASREMRSLLTGIDAAGEYDVIHVVLQRMMQYAGCFNRGKIVLDQIDALSLNMERRAAVEKNPVKKIVFALERARMGAYERQSARQYQAGIITSEVDKQALGDARITVIPNGVDSEYYSFRELPRTIDVLFTGNMGYFPNVNAALYLCGEIAPELVKQDPEVKIFIAGTNPGKAVRALADNRNIFVTGYVPDMREYLNHAKVFVAPLRSGSGIQNKILEAMACELPVVTSPYGNAGINAIHGKHLLVAEDTAGFIREIRGLLRDTSGRNIMGKNGRILVDESFAWAQRAKMLENIYNGIMR